MTTRADIIAHARTYLGVPWRHQGRTRNGLDCGGLAVVVAHHFGLSAFDVSGYAPEPDGVTLRRLLLEHAQPVTQWQAADILLMRFVRYPQHIAIATDYGIIHTYRQVGTVVEHRLDGAWRARIVQAFAFPGVA